MTTAVSLLLLAATLGFAIARPRDLPEVVAAAPAAVLCVVLGLVPLRSAGHEIAVLGPTIGFLAAILLLAHLADVEGVFAYAGILAGRISSRGSRREGRRDVKIGREGVRSSRSTARSRC